MASPPKNVKIRVQEKGLVSFACDIANLTSTLAGWSEVFLFYKIKNITIKAITNIRHPKQEAVSSVVNPVVVLL